MKTLCLSLLLVYLIGMTQCVAAEEFPRTLSFLCNRAEDIVEAEIVDLFSFTHEDGRDYTKITFRVKKVYKGDLNRNDSFQFVFTGKTYDDNKTIKTATGTTYTQGITSIYLMRQYENSKFGMMYGGSDQGRFDINSQMPDVVTRQTVVPLYINSFDEEPLPQTCKLSSPARAEKTHYEYNQVVENIKRIVKEQAEIEMGVR